MSTNVFVVRGWVSLRRFEPAYLEATAATLPCSLGSETQVPLEFLRSRETKTVRTALYNDQTFTLWELELLHTPVVQRLYNLKQLGLADRVFPDATHSRLNHVLGVAEVAERMLAHVADWLETHPDVELAYARHRGGDGQAGWEVRSSAASELAHAVRQRTAVVRMMGLLHDLTHAAFGHTLEDEVCVFAEKHDDPSRQARFFDALTAQLCYFWAVEIGERAPDPDVIDALVHLDVDAVVVKACTDELRTALRDDERQRLILLLRELEVATLLLQHLEFMHGRGHDVPPAPRLLVSEVITCLDEDAPPLDLVLHRDALLIDIVGSTICADLLDYARRDPHNVGLRVQFDDRFIRHLCAVSVSGRLSPTGRPCIRLAVQFFTDKMRHDVLSELSGVLKARYLLNERVLFHHTKCAAGAMLGTVVQLLGLSALPPWLQVHGDQEFTRLLVDLAADMDRALNAGNSRSAASDAEAPRRADSGHEALGRLEQLSCACLERVVDECERTRDDVTERVRGARNLLWRLMSRRYAKAVFRIRSGVHHSGGDNDETLAALYTNPTERFRLQREVERTCHLPPGAIVIHCPKRRMSMKVAEALVVGADLGKVAHLRDVNDITPEPLDPYHDEIRAVEQMYRSIWQFHVFLDSSQLHKRALVQSVVSRTIAFPNDRLLQNQHAARAQAENPYDLIAGPLSGEFPLNLLPDVVRSLDRARLHGRPESVRDEARRIIREVCNSSSE